MATQTDSQYASIKVEPRVRDMVRAQKRGGETYGELLLKMTEQYSPEDVANHSIDGGD